MLGSPMPPPRAARTGRLKESGEVESRIRRAEGISARDKECGACWAFLCRRQGRLGSVARGIRADSNADSGMQREGGILGSAPSR